MICVGWWRGKIKRWNTTFHTSASYTQQTFGLLMNNVGYKNPGDVVGACSGGVASVAKYAGSGGAPIAQTVYFDWQTPSEWIPYNSTVWSTIDPDTPLDASGESAAVVTGRMGALSATGKPVYTRKYLHAIPSRTALDYLEPDIDATIQSAIKGQFLTAYMANPAGVSPAVVDVEPFYLNHQRVRGRRRTTAQVAAQAFSFGVLAGGGATTSGQGEQFPGGEF